MLEGYHLSPQMPLIKRRSWMTRVDALSCRSRLERSEGFVTVRPCSDRALIRSSEQPDQRNGSLVNLVLTHQMIHLPFGLSRMQVLNRFKAKARLAEASGDDQARAKIEAAYDAVLMARLRDRQQGQ